MNVHFRFILIVFCMLGSLVSLASPSKYTSLPVSWAYVESKDSLGSTLFWDKLSGFCGMAFEGKVTEGADNDTFRGKKMVMHVKSCENNQIKIPFFVIYINLYIIGINVSKSHSAF